MNWTKLFKTNQLLPLLIFLISWSYIIIRANQVFYVHDELVSKWAYMINWNFLPFQGYVDANNHFLNSFLGGLFIRLFQSDAIWIVRLPNLLAFPIYFFSLASLKKYFSDQKIYYSFLLSIIFIPFLLDFFNLARGYGLSWAFLFLGLNRHLAYLHNSKISTLLGSMLAFLLTIYANLSLLPLICSILPLQFLQANEKRKNWSWFLLPTPFILYAIYYAIELKEGGKLYLGDQDNFWEISIKPICRHIWGSDQAWILIFLSAICLLLLIHLLRKLLKGNFNQLSKAYIFHIYFFIGLGVIFLQHLIFQVNYPEDRALAHLIPLFLGSLFFSLDHLKRTHLSVTIAVLMLVLFTSKANFSHSLNWQYEHIDPPLLTEMDSSVKGTPPTTGGRFWQIDDELIRHHGLQMRVLQDLKHLDDTLMDYLVSFQKLNPPVVKDYAIKFTDTISGLSLFERRTFVERELITSKENSFLMPSNGEFQNLLVDTVSGPHIIRCSGRLEEIDIYRDIMLIFSAESLAQGEKLEYGGIGPVSSAPIEKDGSISFDFCFLLHGTTQPYRLINYVWKRDQKVLKGELKVRLYKIHQNEE